MASERIVTHAVSYTARATVVGSDRSASANRAQSALRDGPRRWDRLGVTAVIEASFGPGVSNNLIDEWSVG